MAFVNSVLQQARISGQQIFVAKLDILRMFASVSYDFLFETLLHFQVPLPWAQTYMRQVKGNALEISTLTKEVIHIFMTQGVIEGSPISIVAIYLILTRLLSQLRQHPLYSSSIAALEADSIQRGILLHPSGWFDD